MYEYNNNNNENINCIIYFTCCVVTLKSIIKIKWFTYFYVFKKVYTRMTS